jgi:hypothetical protein
MLTRQDSNALVNNLGGKASLRKDLRFKLFKGASIQFKDTKNADKMAAKVATMPKVKAVYPVRRYPVPHHVVHSTGDAVQAVLSKRQEGNDTFSTHLMTQVNQFRDSGVTGKGIKIAIIDTGVSQTHSSASTPLTYEQNRPTTCTPRSAAASGPAAWSRTAPTWSATPSTAATRPRRTPTRSTTAMATAPTSPASSPRRPTTRTASSALPRTSPWARTASLAAPATSATTF